MKWAFNEISLAKYNTEQIFKKAKEMGLRCNKNRFFIAIRNPVYYGKIFIQKFKDEESHLVKGLHEPLISESMYYDIQDILDGKRRKLRTTIMSPKMLPLKGFLHCSKCSRVLCGSTSKGRNNYYYYYHCSSACGYRKKADEVNKGFVDELKNYVLKCRVERIFQTGDHGFLYTCDKGRD